MGDYLPILILFVLAFLFVFGSIVASTVLGPKRRETSAKVAPYECGIIPENQPAERFPVKFYLVAMIFIIFDIEIIFLYPWAVLFNRMGTFALVEMVLFSVAVLVAFVYLLSNGALDWAPQTALKKLEDGLAEIRTSATTIRKVPRPAAAVPAAAASSIPSGLPSEGEAA
jgi:NADH-quinone oxidoreductase subunit A